MVSDRATAPDPGAAGEITEAERDRYADVLKFVANYDGGDCFAALPSLGEATGDLTLETFARTGAELETFRAEMEEEAGVVPNSVLLPIADVQCPALAFLAETANYPAFSIYFDLPKRYYSSGDQLAGRILNTGTDQVYLLIIDDDGTVQSVGPYLQPGDGEMRFSFFVTFLGEQVDTKQVLLAIASEEPLATLDRFSRVTADILFPLLREELRQRRITVDAAMVGVTVE